MILDIYIDVGKYPTNNNDVNLSYFKFLKEIYGDVIQTSSLEGPHSYTPSIAYGAGAKF